MTVRFDVQDSVAVVTLNRPEALNALSIEALGELRKHLCESRDRDDIRVVVLTGAGTRSFCAGADLKATQTSSVSYAEAVFQNPGKAADLGLYIRLMDLTDLGLSKPIIAAINGHCLGAGLEIALQSDIRIASNSATFGLPEAKVGSIPAVSGLHRLMKAVPSAHAMQMALTGEHITAQTAKSIGLITEVLDAPDLLTRALSIAKKISSNAPLAVQALKCLSRQTQHLSEIDAQALTELYWGILRDTQDRTEGRKAFSEKRPPIYIGR